MAIGRISGPLLKSNLVRDGVDLAFETDLLYLDVSGARVGINTASPQKPLDVNGTIRTTDLDITNQLTVGNLTVTGNTISTDQETIFLAPSAGNAVIYHSRLVVDDLQLQGNVISTEVSNSNLELRANGTGIIEIQSNTTVQGNLDVTGNVNVTGDVTIGGNITLGDSTTDNVVITAGIASNLLPDTDNNFDLGSPSRRWRTVYANQAVIDTLNLSNLSVGDLIFSGNSITTTPGQDIIMNGTGTGGVVIGNFSIRGSIITNIAANNVSELTHTGTGFFAIQGTNGVVIPVGTSAERPGSPPVGMMRFNTDNNAVEIYTGITWGNPAGASGAISEIQANETAASIALALG